MTYVTQFSENLISTSIINVNSTLDYGFASFGQSADVRLFSTGIMQSNHTNTASNATFGAGSTFTCAGGEIYDPINKAAIIFEPDCTSNRNANITIMKRFLTILFYTFSHHSNPSRLHVSWRQCFSCLPGVALPDRLSATCPVREYRHVAIFDGSRRI